MELTSDLQNLPSVAAKLIEFAGAETFFVFRGQMGAGKTTFIKAFCDVLGVRDTVSSPTFSIVNEYEGDGKTIYHFDFYRINNLSEAYDIGYEEYFYSGKICLIEWPEKIGSLLPDGYIEVTIDEEQPGFRKFNFSIATA